MPSFVSAILNFCYVAPDYANLLTAISIICVLIALWLLSNFNKAILCILFCLSLLPNLFYVAHLLIFKKALYDEGYYPLFQSPLNEMLNFISLRLTYTIPLILICILLFYFIFKIKTPEKIKDNKLKALIFTISFAPFTYTYLHFLNGNFHYYRGFSPEADFYCSTIDFKNELNRINQLSINDRLIKRKNINSAYPNIVIIIGESTSASHFNSFGYYRNTTPYLSKNKKLKILEAIAPHAHTIESLTKVLGFNNKVNLINKLNKAGYRSIWLSNQKPYGIFESVITAMSKSCDTSIFINNNIKSFNEGYDETLLPYLRTELNNKIKKVIFLHLMGTHEPYIKRYPAEFNYYKEVPKNNFAFNNPSKQNIINQYDNAIRYQDSVLNECFKLLETIENSATFYFSDHGDEVYDEIDIQGHAEAVRSKAMLNVPFVFYVNCPTDTIFINQLKQPRLEDFENILFKSLMIND